jgi:hypothetical protein
MIKMSVRYSKYVAVAQAQINEGIGLAGGVDVAVGHIINEDKSWGDPT